MLNTRQLACESGTPLRSNKAKISHEHLAQHHVQVHWKSHQPSKSCHLQCRKLISSRSNTLPVLLKQLITLSSLREHWTIRVKATPSLCCSVPMHQLLTHFIYMGKKKYLILPGGSRQYISKWKWNEWNWNKTEMDQPRNLHSPPWKPVLASMD